MFAFHFRAGERGALKDRLPSEFMILTTAPAAAIVFVQIDEVGLFARRVGWDKKPARFTGDWDWDWPNRMGSLRFFHFVSFRW